MDELDKYISDIIMYKKNFKHIDEISLLRYIYLDLGLKLSFDLDFYYGNNKKKQTIFNHHINKKEVLSNCLKNKYAICRSMSYILEEVCKKFDINIISISDSYDKRNYPHVYNIVKLKDGRSFSIDIQEDIRNIQTHSRTKYFGVNTIDGKTKIISDEEIEMIDKKIGYISDEYYYANEYIYLLKMYMEYIDDFSDKVEFVIKNLEPYSNQNIDVADRLRRFIEISHKLFTINERNRIRIVDLYQIENEKKKYQSCIAVYGTNKTDIYRFDNKNLVYYKQTIDEFADEVLNGLTVKQGQHIMRLNKALKKKHNLVSNKD